MGVITLERTSGRLERMLFELKGLSNSFRNPNTSFKDLLKINNYYFHSDERVENAVYFVRMFYEDKIRDDKKSSFLNQHLGDVAKNTLMYILENYNWGIEQTKNAFIASLSHDFLEDFPKKAYLLKEKFGEDVYNIVLALTMPHKKDLTGNERNRRKNQYIDKISNISDEEPKIIKPEDYDSNIRSSTNLVLTLAYNAIQNKLRRDTNAYKRCIDFYDKNRPKIIRYINYLDNYIGITKTLPGNLDKKIKRDVAILNGCNNLFYKIFRGDYLRSRLLRQINIPNLYPASDKLALKSS